MADVENLLKVSLYSSGYMGFVTIDNTNNSIYIREILVTFHRSNDVNIAWICLNPCRTYSVTVFRLSYIFDR